MGERARPEISVGAVAARDQALLMVRRGRPPAAGRWSLPGGRVERGETLRAAVVRELAEETGLTGVVEDLVGFAEWVGRRHHFVILDFSVTITGEPDPTAGDDAEEVRWVPVDEVADLELVEGLASWLVDHGVIPGR